MKVRKLIAEAAGLTLLLLALVGCGAFQVPSPSSTLTGIEQLRERFNHGKGKPRLILLMSPT